MAQHQPTDQSMAELVRQASEQTAALVRQELRLAQLELTEKGKRAGLGVGLVGTGTLLLLTGLAVLLVAVILALALVVPPWASALIVAVVLLAVAAARPALWSRPSRAPFSGWPWSRARAWRRARSCA